MCCIYIYIDIDIDIYRYRERERERERDILYINYSHYMISIAGCFSYVFKNGYKRLCTFFSYFCLFC